MVNVTLSGFAPNTVVTVICNDTTPPAGEFYRYNVRTDANGNNFSSVCYYGYPGQTVWITANGVRSPNYRW